MPMPRNQLYAVSPLKAALVPILKLCTLVLGYVIIQVGWHANFHSEFYATYLQLESHRKLCSAAPGCPDASLALESIFHFLTIVSILLSIASLACGFLYPTSSAFQRMDMLFHIVAGGLLFISGCLIIISAALIDGFPKDRPPCTDFKTPEEVAHCNDKIIEKRFNEKFYDKIIAGTFCFILALVYVFTSLSIMKNKNSGGIVAPMVYSQMERPASRNAAPVWTAPEESMADSSMAEDMSAAEYSETVESSDVTSDSERASSSKHHRKSHHHKADNPENPEEGHHSHSHGSHKEHGGHHKGHGSHHGGHHKK